MTTEHRNLISLREASRRHGVRLMTLSTWIQYRYRKLVWVAREIIEVQGKGLVGAGRKLVSHEDSIESLLAESPRPPGSKLTLVTLRAGSDTGIDNPIEQVESMGRPVGAPLLVGAGRKINGIRREKKRRTPTQGVRLAYRTVYQTR
jgi:hypothetical protein